MPLITPETLQRFFTQGEEHLSHDKFFLFDRVSLNITSNTAIYTLPDYCISIRRVTWLGWALDPLPRRNFREVFQSATQKSRPFWYIYNNVGQNQIQLFPAPTVNLAQVSDLWNTAGTNAFEQGCVIEFARISDNARFIVPPYLRRQLLKQYTAKMTFSIDGSGQNLKAVQYFDNRWKIRKQRFFDFVDELHNKPRKLIVDEIVSSNYFPAPPVLPIDRFGTPVDEGY